MDPGQTRSFDVGETQYFELAGLWQRSVDVSGMRMTERFLELPAEALSRRSSEAWASLAISPIAELR